MNADRSPYPWGKQQEAQKVVVPLLIPAIDEAAIKALWLEMVRRADDDGEVMLAKVGENWAGRRDRPAWYTPARRDAILEHLEALGWVTLTDENEGNRGRPKIRVTLHAQELQQRHEVDQAVREEEAIGDISTPEQRLRRVASAYGLNASAINTERLRMWTKVESRETQGEDREEAMASLMPAIVKAAEREARRDDGLLFDQFIDSRSWRHAPWYWPHQEDEGELAREIAEMLSELQKSGERDAIPAPRIKQANDDGSTTIEPMGTYHKRVRSRYRMVFGGKGE